MGLAQDEQKKKVAAAALDEVRPLVARDVIIGIGTGSTADCFIDDLASLKGAFAGAVASSERSAQRLSAAGIHVFDLNEVTSLPVYVDGADEVNPQLAMIKGGGGALTREKIVAAVAQRFICIVDSTKLVATLGAFPLPVEVIPMACAQVTRSLVKLCGAQAGITIRRDAQGNTLNTDNGNLILDVAGLQITDAIAMERSIEEIVGVIACGLFARRCADLLLIAGANGIERRF